MRIGVWRVWYHAITEKVVDGKTVEVSHTSPVMEMVAAESVDKLFASLPVPLQRPGTVTRNVITQIDQKHKSVLLAQAGTTPAGGK